jgi:hypothetical protein
MRNIPTLTGFVDVAGNNVLDACKSGIFDLFRIETTAARLTESTGAQN